MNLAKITALDPVIFDVNCESETTIAADVGVTIDAGTKMKS